MAKTTNPDNHYIFMYWLPDKGIKKSGLIDADSATKLWNDIDFDDNWVAIIEEVIK